MGHIQYLHIRAHNNNNPPPPSSSSLPSSSSTTTTTIPLSPHLPTPTPPEDVPNDNENLHISGHALMATAPSYTSIMQHHHHQQQQQHPASKTTTPPPYTPQFPPFTQRKDLIHLLNLSANLEICEQEVPPVRAWVKLMQNPRVRNSFGCEELEEVKEWLVGKVCCYRYVWTFLFSLVLARGERAMLFSVSNQLIESKDTRSNLFFFSFSRQIRRCSRSERYR